MANVPSHYFILVLFRNKRTRRNETWQIEDVNCLEDLITDVLGWQLVNSIEEKLTV